METRKILTILVLRSKLLRRVALVLVAAVLVGSGQEASGGTLEAWGRNDYGQCDVPAGNDFVAVAGSYHSLGLKSDGSLAAWGRNDYGQCDVPAGNDFAAIAAGRYHSFALKSDGSLAAWGYNGYGQCDVPAGNDFVAVAASGFQSLSLKSDGSLSAWGDNYYGQCDVPAGNDFVAVAAGERHSLALKSDGSLAGWGDNGNGQCDVPAGNDFAAIAAGGYHGLALKSDGSLAGWGYNYYGQCNVPAGNDFAAIAGGGYHGLALKSDGSLAAWGRNDYGQCDVPAGNDFVAVAGGGTHSLAIAMTVQPMGNAFTYQGRLLDEGSPAEGLYDFKFKLFNANVAGMQKGSTIDINDLDVLDGYFVVELDFGSEVFEGMARWLEIGVRPGELEDPCDYTILEPRQELTPTPYALYAKTAGGIPGGISGSGTANYIAKFTGPNTIADSAIYEEAGNVGIGTTSPSEKLEVNGTVEATAFVGDGSGLTGISTGDSDWTISGDDMYSIPSGNVGIGTTEPYTKLTVEGTITASAEGTAVSASSSGGSGRGVYGYASGSSGYGVHGSAGGGEGRGIYGVGGGSNGVGVYGGASNSGMVTNYGGYFVAYGRSGRGIYARGGVSGYAAEFKGNVLIRSRSTGLTVMELGEGLDYAEGFDVSESTKIGAGSVLIIDSKNPGKLALSDKAYDTKVAGIVAGAKGMGSGVRLGTDQFDCDVALAGRVYCNVDATEAAVQPGDLLTTSATRGYAMKAADYARAQGAILGKAMEKLEKGEKGQILVLVTLQ